MNEIIESPKVTPQGLIKVELFDDATGKKVEEVNTHNFIAQGVLKNMFNARINDVFTRSRPINGFEVSTIFNDPFARLSLTTANHQEDPLNEWLLAGEMVGYALSDITYSGSDNMRGGYNAAESFTKQNHVRMVFDFPTNAVNGEFKSIYFHPKDFPHQRVIYTQAKQIENAYSAKKYNGFYYVLKSRKLEKYDLSWFLQETYDLDSNFYDFEIVENVIYYVGYQTTNTIKKANLENPSSTNNVLSIPNSECGGIFFDNDKSHFIIGNYQYGSKKLMYYDKDFTHIKNVDLSDTVNASPSVGSLFIDGDFFIIGKQYIDYEGNVKDFQQNSLIGVTDDELMISNYILPKTYIGSRCLLDAPITKTDKQTMKITYDFKLPSIF